MYPTRDNTSDSTPNPAGASVRRRGDGAPPRVLVVGAGALGCAAVRTLAASRAVSVTLVDFDAVELSNLQRQVLYTDADIGRAKVDAAAARVAAESGVAIDAREVRFDETTGPSLVAVADLVIDATDDPDAKFLIARLCAEQSVPSVYGGVARTGGQWMLTVPGESACLACVFPQRAGAIETAAGCAALGILAPVAGFVGSMQAATALAFLEDAGSVAAGRLHLYELTGERSRTIDFPIDDACGCRAAASSIATRGHAATAAVETFLEENRS